MKWKKSNKHANLPIEMIRFELDGRNCYTRMSKIRIGLEEKTLESEF